MSASSCCGLAAFAAKSNTLAARKNHDTFYSRAMYCEAILADGSTMTGSRSTGCRARDALKKRHFSESQPHPTPYFHCGGDTGDVGNSWGSREVAVPSGFDAAIQG